MKPAIWFSRHDPTAAQLKEIGEWSYNLVALPEGIQLGSQSINSVEEKNRVLRALSNLVLKNKAMAIFGVFPAPIQEELVIVEHRKEATNCYSAWNIQRAVEGGKPTFEHRCFCFVGWLPPAREY